MVANTSVTDAVAALTKLQRETVSEKKIVEQSEKLVQDLRSRYPRDRQFFTTEHIDTIKEAKVVVEHLKKFTEVLSDMESLNNMDEYIEYMQELTGLAEFFEGFQVQKRVAKEIRELHTRRGGLQQTEQSRALSALNAKGGKCPKCGNVMTLRKGDGPWFWGCSQFPDCWHKRALNESELEAAADL